MKKWIAVVLAAMMLCAGFAQAANWVEGTSPSKPYSGVPEIDLSANIGYMMFYPSVSLPVQYACQQLFIYLPREDVQAGDGTLYVYNEADGEVWRTAMNDTAAVTVRPIDESELVGLMWGGGTCFEVKLPRTLELGKDYFINMTRGCIVTEDGSVDNPEVGGTTDWAFTVEGEFGVSGMEYLRDGENTQYPTEGDTIRFDLQLGGDAASAVIYGYSDSVDFTTTMFTESGEVTGSVSAAAPAWGVMFLDINGDELDRVEF